ncbi:MAG: tetratricopeptide repeat protein, partial [Bacteroidales bacterium]|nr:tetratricopeptide repeat protein [Bacteroidales bacterium]
MRRLIIILFFICGTAVYGQNLNFIQVDTTTYNQYLRGDWKELTISGKEALDAGIDYYYLQMRIAYAWFSMGRYRQAIKYYRNALGHNSRDPIANEYLYYAYKYSGRDNDALFQTAALTTEQKGEMGINDSISFVSFGLNYAWSTSNAGSIMDRIVDGVEELGNQVNGIQKATHNLNFAQVGLSHRLGKAVILKHQGAYLHKNELSYAIGDGNDYLSPEQPVSQFEYSANMEITPVKGWLITPGIHYLYSTLPIYDATSYVYGVGAGAGAGANRTPVTNLKIRKWVTSIQVETKARFFDLGMSFVHHNFKNIGTLQTGVHAVAYPLANLNLYLSIDGYAQFHSFNGVTKTELVIKPLVGVKLHDNFWLEVTGRAPEHYNFYDVRNTIAYNNIEKNASVLEVNGIIPLYRSNMQIFIGYKYQT